MRKIMVMMTILMGFTMSSVLSLLGTGMSGHFTMMSWLVSFAISFAISLAIGFIVPVKKICDGACKKAGIVPESMKGNLLSSLVSDFIYTPIITVVMVVIMVGNATKQMQAHGITENLPSIPHALVPSLIVSLVVGYIVICIVQPIFIKILVGKKKECGPQS